MPYKIRGDQVRFSLGPTDDGQYCEAAADTFVALNENYGTDARHVFFQGIRVEEAEARSFQVLGRFHGKDAAHVFWRTRVMVEASPQSFDSLGFDYGRDGDTIFDCLGRMSGVDAPTFEVLNEEYTRDSRNLYRFGKPVPGVRPGDVAAWGPYLRVGEVCHYNWQPIPDADASTFRGWEGDYAVDARRAYFRGAAISGAKAASFAPEGVAVASDGERNYAGGVSLKVPLDPQWLQLPFEALKTKLALPKLLKSTAKGDAKAMAKVAHVALYDEEDGFEALLWARLAHLFGGKRLVRLESDARLLLDPHEEIGEIDSEVSYSAAMVLWEGRDVPRHPQDARVQLARALREGLGVSMESLTAHFGPEEVLAASLLAKEPAKPAARKRKTGG